MGKTYKDQPWRKSQVAMFKKDSKPQKYKRERNRRFLEEAS